jgi:hypothetical protein
MSVSIVEIVLLRITLPSEAEMVLSVTSEPSSVDTSSGRKANRRWRKAESLMFLFGKRTSRRNMAERISDSIDLERGKGTTARCCRINTSRSHGELGVE